MDEKKIDKLIEQAINRVGLENDEQDLTTLRTFLETRELKSTKSASASVRMVKQKPSKIKRIWLSVASIAAIITVVFSLNIYQQNTRMDEAFYTHYSPLEYDHQLMSRGESSPLSSALNEAMEAYQSKEYSTALQKFNSIPNVDENFLIYKAICLIEIDQLSQAIHLLEELVAQGETTEYYQQANWYLVLAYLKAHEREKVDKLIKNCDIPNFMNIEVE